MISFLPNSRSFGLHISQRMIAVASLGGLKNSRVSSISIAPLGRNPWLKNGLRDKDKLSQLISQAVEDAQPHAITYHRAVCTLPESAVFTKIIKLPKLSKKELIQTIPFEAADSLPLPLEEVYLDWQIDEVVHEGDKPTLHVAVVAAPKRLIDDLIEVTSNAGIELAAIESQPFSIVRSINHLLSPKNVSIVLDIEEDITTTILASQKKVKFTSTILTGSKKIQQNQREGATKLAEEIGESIKYYHNRLGEKEKISNILLVGEGALLPNLTKDIEQYAKLPCFIGHLPINLPNGSSVHTRFNTVFGLAMWKRGE